MKYRGIYFEENNGNAKQKEKSYIVHHWIAKDFHQNQHSVSLYHAIVSSACHQLPGDDRVEELQYSSHSNDHKQAIIQSAYKATRPFHHTCSKLNPNHICTPEELVDIHPLCG
jgi:hypothetical protein